MTNWNHIFSTLIRQSRPAYWGNWGLNMQIKPGAVGIIDTTSGDFRRVGDLPEVKVIDYPASSTWNLMSEHVSRQESTVNLDGSAVDPETQTKIEAGLEVKWGMEKAGSLASEFSLSNESTIDDAVILQNMDNLANMAASVNMGSKGNIAQGFGVITGVLWADSGLNIGSNEDKSNFSIKGSVSGINEMVGRATGKGSYISTTSDKSLDQHIWPAKSGSIAPTRVPIAYKFTSFDGHLMIPNWIMHLGSFKLVLINKPGCTYVTKVRLTYNTPEGPHERKVTISGGLTETFGDIPLNSEMLKLHITFIGMINDDNYDLHWDKPLGEWLTGQRHIEMSGVWPGETKRVDREAK
ncbi:MAG: hypothetical protein WBH08_04930 [Methanothrix sp.]|uniref:hypothetical protein n=1 Tax=Methanothrix sp. TaxID=90426 RepID=UPI003BB73710